LSVHVLPSALGVAVVCTLAASEPASARERERAELAAGDQIGQPAFLLLFRAEQQ